MRARSLIALIVAAVWFAPAAHAGAVAVHLAFEHAPADESDQPGANAARIAAETSVAGSLSIDGIGHLHAIDSASTPARCVARHDSLLSPALASTVTLAVPGPDHAPASSASRPFHGGLAGPPLLALLSTLRV